MNYKKLLLAIVEAIEASPTKTQTQLATLAAALDGVPDYYCASVINAGFGIAPEKEEE